MRLRRFLICLAHSADWNFSRAANWGCNLFAVPRPHQSKIQQKKGKNSSSRTPLSLSLTPATKLADFSLSLFRLPLPPISRKNAPSCQAQILSPNPLGFLLRWNDTFQNRAFSPLLFPFPQELFGPELKGFLFPISKESMLKKRRKNFFFLEKKRRLEKALFRHQETALHNFFSYSTSIPV